MSKPQFPPNVIVYAGSTKPHVVEGTQLPGRGSMIEQMRTWFRSLPTDDARCEALHELGICRHCGRIEDEDEVAYLRGCQCWNDE